MRLPYNLRMIARALVVLLLLVGLSYKTSAGDRKEWVKLIDCHYVDAPDNDGDSFRVRGGDKEFTARLYYVDAPETNLRQGDRTHDQSIHFGITLDETMKAGEKAKQRKRTFTETVPNLDALGHRRRPRSREPILCDCRNRRKKPGRDFGDGRIGANKGSRT